MKKIEKEKQRKEQLEEAMEEAKLRLRLIQDKTKNGNIVKDHEMMNKKLLGRLEHQLQMSKIKLSTSKNENITLKAKVQDLRREKLLHLQILNDLVRLKTPFPPLCCPSHCDHSNLSLLSSLLYIYNINRQRRSPMLDEERSSARRRLVVSMRRSTRRRWASPRSSRR